MLQFFHYLFFHSHIKLCELMLNALFDGCTIRCTRKSRFNSNLILNFQECEWNTHTHKAKRMFNYRLEFGLRNVKCWIPICFQLISARGIFTFLLEFLEFSSAFDFCFGYVLPEYSDQSNHFKNVEMNLNENFAIFPMCFFFTMLKWKQMRA